MLENLPKNTQSASLRNTYMTSFMTALIGLFIGSFLTRTTEYEKWLRQQRSIEFTEFIKQFENYSRNISEILYSQDLDKREKDIKVTEESIKLKAQENIVRMYLSKEDRQKFSALKHEMWALSYPSVSFDERSKIHKARCF